MKSCLWIIGLALLLCPFVGCRELEEFKAQAMLEEQNKALAKRYYKEWTSKNLEALREILSPEYVWHTGEQDLSLEQTLKVAEEQKAAFTDRNIRIDDLIASGDRVVMCGVGSATLNVDIQGNPTKGKKFESKGIDILRIENGKIVESWEVFDTLSFYQQLGFELKFKEEETSLN